MNLKWNKIDCQIEEYFIDSFVCCYVIRNEYDRDEEECDAVFDFLMCANQTAKDLCVVMCFAKLTTQMPATQPDCNKEKT